MSSDLVPFFVFLCLGDMIRDHQEVQFQGHWSLWRPQYSFVQISFKLFQKERRFLFYVLFIWLGNFRMTRRHFCPFDLIINSSVGLCPCKWMDRSRHLLGPFSCPSKCLDQKCRDIRVTLPMSLKYLHIFREIAQ